MDKKTNPYAGHRYPTEIIRHAVWLYFRSTLSFRDVEEILTYPGVIVSYEPSGNGCSSSGKPTPIPSGTDNRARYGDKWHLDEVVLTMNGKHRDLWRAGDQDGIIVLILC